MGNNRGTVYWITGLSGAGKTTIGTKLYKHLKGIKDNAVFLDGDALRKVFQNADYSYEGRKSMAYQYGRLCWMLSEQGIDVVCCCIAMFDECRQWNRNNIDNYKEIYLKVNIEVLIQRDQKKLYSKAINKEIKNVMGIDLEFDEPKLPDVIIKNDGSETPEKIVECIINNLNIRKCK